LLPSILVDVVSRVASHTLVFSGEQVAAAEATALSVEGVKQVIQNEASLAAQNILNAKNRTLSGQRSEDEKKTISSE